MNNNIHNDGHDDNNNHDNNNNHNNRHNGRRDRHVDVDVNRDTIILDIDNIGTITNGSLDDMRTIENPNQVGRVVYKDTGAFISYINPMIMIINQGLSDYKERIAHMIANGGNIDANINYYGRITTPRETAISYRDYDE